MVWVFGGVGALCLTYYGIIIWYAGITANAALIWPVFAGIFAASGLFLKIQGRHPGLVPRWIPAAFLAASGAGLVLLLCLCGAVIRGMYRKVPDGLDQVVVLGAQVKGRVPSRALQKRLERALSYSLENPDTIWILSGARGSGEDITEALCMKNWLLDHGIPEKNLLLEESSTSTLENLVFSAELYGCDKGETGILTNNFHIYRAIRLAEKLGYRSVYGIPAASDPVMQVHYIVREAFALVKEKAAGNL